MNTKSQQERIIKHLMRGRKLTRAQAMEQLGIANVTARISELRQAGYDIADTWKTQRNRFGDVCKFKVYYLAKAA